MKLSAMVVAFVMMVTLCSGCAMKKAPGEGDGQPVSSPNRTEYSLKNAKINMPGAASTGETTPPGAGTSERKGATEKFLDITPFTTIIDEDAPAPFSSSRANTFNNTYTRIAITGTLYEDTDQTKIVDPMNYERASMLERLFTDRTCNLNLSAKVVVGDFVATVPLMTTVHGHDGDGEKWSRAVTHKLLDYPLFLIRGDGQDSVPQFTISLVGSDARTSQAAALALQMVTASIKIVSPTAGVLTDLTTQENKDRANVIDTAISKLFSSSIAEEHVSHRDLRYAAESGGVSILLKAPTRDCKWDDDLGNMGVWRISFDAPRPSIFSNWRICSNTIETNMCQNSRDAALAKVRQELAGNPGKVLSFKLTGGSADLGTIRSYIVQQPWYASAEAAFTGTANSDMMTADALCQNIANEIQTIGLNGDDAAFVVWAVINGLPHSAKRHASAFSGPACTRFISNTEIGN